jgi:hypothetical protein
MLGYSLCIYSTQGKKIMSPGFGLIDGVCFDVSFVFT